jgi:hypothetical protein
MIKIVISKNSESEEHKADLRKRGDFAIKKGNEKITILIVTFILSQSAFSQKRQVVADFCHYEEDSVGTYVLPDLLP